MIKILIAYHINLLFVNNFLELRVGYTFHFVRMLQRSIGCSLKGFSSSELEFETSK